MSSPAKTKNNTPNQHQSVCTSTPCRSYAPRGWNNGYERYGVMANKFDAKTDPGQPVVYQIRIKGHLGPQWTYWFERMAITLQDNGDTLLTGPVVDQAALHGLLKKVRDLGMPLISAVRVRPLRDHSLRVCVGSPAVRSAFDPRDSGRPVGAVRRGLAHHQWIQSTRNRPRARQNRYRRDREDESIKSIEQSNGQVVAHHHDDRPHKVQGNVEQRRGH